MYKRKLYLLNRIKKCDKNVQDKVTKYLDEKYIARNKGKFDQVVADYLQTRFPDYDLYVRDDGFLFCKITQKRVQEAKVVSMLRFDYLEFCEKHDITFNNRAFKYCVERLMGGYYVNGLLAGSPYPFTDKAFNYVEIEDLDSNDIL
jgi:hypothetical protein